MKVKMLLAGWIALLSLAFVTAGAQKYSRAALRADLDTLYKTLQEVHVDLFAVAGRPKLDSMVAAMHAQIAAADSMEFGAFYKSLIPFFEAIGDGHTCLPVASVSGSLPAFPFGVALPDDSTIQVRHNYLSDNSLPVGSRIDSINGQSAAEIIRKLVTLRPGERTHFRLASMEKEFYRYYALFYRNNSSGFLVQATTPEGTVYRDTVPGIPYQKMRSLMAAEKIGEPFRFDILSDTVALFDFRSMGGQYEERFMPFLDSMFRTLHERGIPNLVIDIRKNGGGNSALGDALMRYISRKPFAQIGTMLTKQSSQVPKVYMSMGYRYSYPKDYTDEMILADLNKREPFGTVSTYCTSPKSLIRPLSKRDRYRGKVWLLTSHYTFSSAAKLAWAFKYFDMGSVVGEETGGLAVSFGDMIMLQMPNSRLSYSVSYKRFYNYGATDRDIHGTLPDYPVSADDALDYTLKLIRGKAEPRR